MKVLPFTLVYLCTSFAFYAHADEGWKKHVLQEGKRSLTAVAGDFTGDGMPDVIAEVGEQTVLFAAPDWRRIVLDDHTNDRGCIHSECFDVDGDGDLDYLSARYNPGLITWLEQPKKGGSTLEKTADFRLGSWYSRPDER